MTLTLTKNKTLSYFVYRAVKIAIFCFAQHSALSLGCFSIVAKRKGLPMMLYEKGRDPFNQNFRKFRSKTQWIGSVQPERFRINGSTFWGGPLFPVGPVGILVEWIASKRDSKARLLVLAVRLFSQNPSSYWSHPARLQTTMLLYRDRDETPSFFAASGLAARVLRFCV